MGCGEGEVSGTGEVVYVTAIGASNGMAPFGAERWRVSYGAAGRWTNAAEDAAGGGCEGARGRATEAD